MTIAHIIATAAFAIIAALSLRSVWRDLHRTAGDVADTILPIWHWEDLT